MTQGRPILGVDITPNEVRIVEMRGIWPHAQITHADCAPLPPGVLDGAHVVSPELLAGVIRSLTQKMGVDARDAVIGLPGRGVIARVIEVPNVPDREMPLVIEGELDHYQILRDGGGKFDYCRLQTGSEPADGPIQILLMAAEDAIINGYRGAASQAGLKVSALEPAHAGIFRAVVSQTQGAAATVSLTVSHQKTELGIVESGAIRLYRRIDIGADDLISSRRAAAGSENTPSAEPRRLALGELDELSEPQPAASRADGFFELSAASSLATEIQRSLSYFRRKHPEAPAIDQIVLSSNDPEVAPIAEWLHRALDIEVVLISVPAAWATGVGTAETLEIPGSLRYSAAAGLCLHRIAEFPTSIPAFDLSSQERVDLNVEAARRKLMGSLTGAIAAVVIGGLLAIGIGIKASIVQTKLNHAKGELVYKKNREQFLASSLQARIDQLTALKPDGLPLTAIMDSITADMDSHVGLNDSSVDATGKVNLAGEAANDQSVIATIAGLKMDPTFDNPSVDSFYAVSATPTRKAFVQFKISSELAGFEQKKPAPAP
ncbi:MAG TPA: pilus assembly protein PilM [Chthonomonadales bacterium]|nr:pilus assembly protein PilM [Chthonomonadales bacterium]